MISKYTFVLRSYRVGGGDSDDAIPRWFIVELTTAQASYYLKRIALVNEVQKVDQALQSMIYRETTGEWWYHANSDESGPPAGEESTSVEGQEVMVYDHKICWKAYHDASGNELISEEIHHSLLLRLSKGEDPYKVQPENLFGAVAGGVAAAMDAGPFQAMPHLPTTFIHPANPGEQIQVQFVGPEHDEHHDPEPEPEDEGEGEDEPDNDDAPENGDNGEGN